MLLNGISASLLAVAPVGTPNDLPEATDRFFEANTQDLENIKKRIADRAKSLEEKIRVNTINMRLIPGNSPLGAVAVVQNEDYIDVSMSVMLNLRYYFMGWYLAQEYDNPDDPYQEWHRSMLASEIEHMAMMTSSVITSPGMLVVGMSVKDWDGWVSGRQARAAWDAAYFALEFIVSHESAHHVLRQYGDPSMSREEYIEVERRADMWALKNMMNDAKRGKVACAAATLAISYIDEIEKFRWIATGGDSWHPAKADRAIWIAEYCQHSAPKSQRALWRETNALLSAKKYLEYIDIDEEFEKVSATDESVRYGAERRLLILTTHAFAYRALRKGDLRLATTRLKSAAAMGYVGAQFDYGSALFWHKKRVQEGLFWFKRALDAGYIQAVQQFELVRQQLSVLPGGQAEICVFETVEKQFGPMWSQCAEAIRAKMKAGCSISFVDLKWTEKDCYIWSHSFENTTIVSEECIKSLKPIWGNLMRSARGTCK